MTDPMAWQWIWLLVVLIFALGEMATPGSFFMLPFAVGAAVAAVLSWVDLSLSYQWLAFVGMSAATFAAFRPVSRWLDISNRDVGVGSLRVLGQEGTVLEDIPGNEGLGLVLVEREEWRAMSTDGIPIRTGTLVQVAELRGTRVVVSPLDTYSPGSPGGGARR